MMTRDETKVSKKHIAMHLEKYASAKIDLSGYEPLDAAAQIMTKFASNCYYTSDLAMITRYFKPKVFVETGVGYGVSSVFTLSGLAANKEVAGKLYSIDLPRQKYVRDNGKVQIDFLPPDHKVGCLVPDYLFENWTLILGDSKVELPKLLYKLGTIDAFHHDSVHTYEFMTFEYETVFPHLKKGGLLLSDDVLWNDAFVGFCKRHNMDYRICKNRGVTIKN